MNERDLTRFRWLAVASLVTVAAAVTPGCDDTLIDPFRNEGRIFTVYGFLDQFSRDHAVRVMPVSRSPERIESLSDPQAEIDARVFSTNLETGDRIQWSHELRKFSNGRYGHVFTAGFAVAPATTYRLEIIRSDSSVATAETRLPYVADVSLLELGPLLYNADSTVVQQDVTIPEVKAFWDIRAFYLFDSGDDAVRLPVNYGRSGVAREDGGWTVRFDYTADMVVTRDSLAELIRLGQLPDTRYGVTMVGVRVRLLDDNWQIPSDESDLGLLSQPGALSNVQNGYGFWGSLTTFRHDWDVTSDFSQALGNPF